MDNQTRIKWLAVWTYMFELSMTLLAYNLLKDETNSSVHKYGKASASTDQRI